MPCSVSFFPPLAFFDATESMAGLVAAAPVDWHGTTVTFIVAVTEPAGVVSTSEPLVAPVPTRAYMMMFEPTMTSDDGTPPIETLGTAPSDTNPVPLIVVMVPGQAPPPAVTMSGVAPFPPIQLRDRRRAGGS